ncbi:poly polymerase and DNA-ligase Zn-finger region-domain-containing protein [Endogone sp. FLAS-F59071]|nr:poly polymerase and DNA-ligase Zn-finger region-domain-containing protein [Endogone sp. FLAS-F59071]|eukprot:RUS15874.1 poly polymerase and DNA-ligase Zn-finger region-domain-containing protein [Endogone sp. FLAS-F59071]
MSSYEISLLKTTRRFSWKIFLKQQLTLIYTISPVNLPRLAIYFHSSPKVVNNLIHLYFLLLLPSPSPSSPLPSSPFSLLSLLPPLPQNLLPLHLQNARAKCTAKSKCTAERKIEKGQLRLGVLVESDTLKTFKWRHWGCVTEKVLQNLQEKYESIGDLPGFNDLNEQDQERVRKASAEGHVSEIETETERKNLAGGDSVGEAGKKPAAKKQAKTGEVRKVGRPKKKTEDNGQDASATKKDVSDGDDMASVEPKYQEVADKKRNAPAEGKDASEPAKRGRKKKEKKEGEEAREEKEMPKKDVEAEGSGHEMEEDIDMDMPDEEEENPPMKSKPAAKKAIQKNGEGGAPKKRGRPPGKKAVEKGSKTATT